jgi:hypothetical protein
MLPKSVHRMLIQLVVSLIYSCAWLYRGRGRERVELSPSRPWQGVMHLYFTYLSWEDWCRAVLS